MNLLDELARLHDPTNGWIFVRELRLGTGWGGFKEQRLDAWAIQAWHTNGTQNLRRSFELKKSASDLLKELRDPDKRWMAYAYSHEFYFVAHKGLIDPKLLTRDDGLMEHDGTTMKIVKAPRQREAMPPRWDFVCSLARTLNPSVICP